jgi:nicotinamidase-related amidase
MLNTDSTALIVIDIQVALTRVMHEKDRLIDKARRLVQGANALGLPIILTEQYPKGLGHTIPEIAELIEPEPVEKTAFSCCGEEAFVAAVEALGRRQLLLCGIETHVCVYQTARELAERGYEVEVVADAVSSRTIGNKLIGLDRIKAVGAKLTTVEMALFELLKVAGGDAFKQVVKIVK